MYIIKVYVSPALHERMPERGKEKYIKGIDRIFLI